jgi:hypothetical protein
MAWRMPFQPSRIPASIEFSIKLFVCLSGLALGQGSVKVSKQRVEEDKLCVIGNDRGGNALFAINQSDIPFLIYVLIYPYIYSYMYPCTCIYLVYIPMYLNIPCIYLPICSIYQYILFTTESIHDFLPACSYR